MDEDRRGRMLLLGTAALAAAIAGAAVLWWRRRQWGGELQRLGLPWHWKLGMMGRGGEGATGTREMMMPDCQSQTSLQTVDLRQHTLFVCTTCNVAKREGTTPSPSPPSGPDLFRRLVAALATSLPGAQPAHVETVNVEATYEFPCGDGSSSVLRVRPQKCLNACRRANCVAFSHPAKYQYHFAMLDAHEAADIEDLVTFARFYCTAPGDAYTKKADRPPRLATTLVSRLPPPMLQ